MLGEHAWTSVRAAEEWSEEMRSIMGQLGGYRRLRVSFGGRRSRQPVIEWLYFRLARVECAEGRDRRGLTRNNLKLRKRLKPDIQAGAPRADDE